ncbi:MAG: M67 family metallopeptidase [Deltaproteobacteria bacterium]|nr:M67 family metallopeptidase [Deltaproteobacteria bacterium]
MKKELLDQIFAESCKRYPEEACGFVLGKGGAASEVIPVQNIQNDLHAKDPKRFPRDAKIAYTIDPKEMEAIQKKAASQGQTIISIFHSHPEHGVYFSEEDKGMAAPWGEPLFPDLSYLVVSVYSGEIKNASEFYWDKNKKDFTERKIL